MAEPKLTKQQLASLRPLEQQLRVAVRRGSPEVAVEIATKIQALFPHDRRHHRLLRAKLWAFEACMEGNRLNYATSGFIGIRKIAGKSTRLYLEASSLLAVCYLRDKNVSEAKRLICEVVGKINNISSERTRQQFQKRLIQRIEEECILAEMIDTLDGEMNVNDIHDKAVLLIQRSNENDILKLIGNSIPLASIKLLEDIRNYSIKQLPPPDRKQLPPPDKATAPRELGKATFAILRRIIWKAVCAPDSSIYKLWSQHVPKVFNPGYFASAVVATLSDFRIGAPMVASGVLALIMKYSAQEFCDLAKPKGLMIDRDERDG